MPRMPRYFSGLSDYTTNAPAPQDKAGTYPQFSAQNHEKAVDARGAVCYIMYYLSAERFIFCAHFSALKEYLLNTGRQCPQCG